VDSLFVCLLIKSIPTASHISLSRHSNEGAPEGSAGTHPCNARAFDLNQQPFFDSDALHRLALVQGARREKHVVVYFTIYGSTLPGLIHHVETGRARLADHGCANGSGLHLTKTVAALMIYHSEPIFELVDERLISHAKPSRHRKSL
jgi:hypothetical protein